MPGRNKKGRLGQGLRTGRGVGACTTKEEAVQEGAGTTSVEGVGIGRRGGGKGRCSGGGRGRGRRQ